MNSPPCAEVSCWTCARRRSRTATSRSCCSPTTPWSSCWCRTTPSSGTWDLELAGRGRVKDSWFEETPTSRTIKVTGQVRHGEVRCRRGGSAVLPAMFTRECIDDLRRANREGTYPTVIDPANTPPGTPRRK